MRFRARPPTRFRVLQIRFRLPQIQFLHRPSPFRNKSADSPKHGRRNQMAAACSPSARNAPSNLAAPRVSSASVFLLARLSVGLIGAVSRRMNPVEAGGSSRSTRPPHHLILQGVCFSPMLVSRRKNFRRDSSSAERSHYRRGAAPGFTLH